MKNYLKLLLVISIGIASCKKDHQPAKPPVTGDKVYSLNFKLDPTSMSLHSGGSKLKVNSAVPAAGNLKTLTYLLYDSNGKYLRQVVQDSTFSNFGTIADSVKAGTYYAFFLGNAATKMFLTDLAHCGFYPDLTLGPNLDLYYHKETIVVTTNNINNNNIVLDRTSALLELNIQDAVPADAASILINTEDSGSGYMLADTSAAPSYLNIYFLAPAFTHNFTAAEIGTHNVKLDRLIYFPHKAHPIAIHVLNTSGNIRNVINVTADFIRNHKTILSGNVFDKYPPDIDNDWTITINTDWGNTTTIGF